MFMNTFQWQRNAMNKILNLKKQGTKFFRKYYIYIKDHGKIYVHKFNIFLKRKYEKKLLSFPFYFSNFLQEPVLLLQFKQFNKCHVIEP